MSDDPPAVTVATVETCAEGVHTDAQDVLKWAQAAPRSAPEPTAAQPGMVGKPARGPIS